MDIYKTEVFQVAQYLGVPTGVINRKPKGDVWDGRTDSEMIGADYPTIDAFLDKYLDNDSDLDKLSLETLTDDESAILEHIGRNYHKFQVGVPCHTPFVI